MGRNDAHTSRVSNDRDEDQTDEHTRDAGGRNEVVNTSHKAFGADGNEDGGDDQKDDCEYESELRFFLLFLLGRLLWFINGTRIGLFLVLQ